MEAQKIALVILYRRSKLSLVDFIAQLPELRWVKWLQLKEIPGKSTLHDWTKKFTTEFTRTLNLLLLKEEQPEIMAVDGTGLDSWQRSRHYENRIRAPKMPYAKLDLFTYVKTMLIHDHVMRIKPRHDVIAAHAMFKRTPHRGVLILGDKGYDSEPLHEEAKAKNNTLFAPVRNKGSKVRGKNRRRCTTGHENYNKRSTIESVNHAFKARRCSALRSKQHHMKKRELAWHILIYNLEIILKLPKNATRILLYKLQSLIPDRPLKKKRPKPFLIILI
ncbi:MAG: transposase [Candidatus Nanoarchaeia archaeon]